MSETHAFYLDENLQIELHEIYSQYHNSIKGFIGQLEILQNKFPVEILNEIRAVFSHIAKIYMCNDSDTAHENLNKAKGHIKRAQLDAFKYMCYAYSKYYKDFRDLYKNVDLSYVDNCKFIPNLSLLYDDAIKKSNTAKNIEHTSDDVTDSYEAYENAYVAYTELYLYISDNLPTIYKLQQKEKLQQEKLDSEITTLKEEITQLKEGNKKEKCKNTILTILSIVLGVLSVVLGFIALR